jgi:mono/diheme cytochrome c family protein
MRCVLAVLVLVALAVLGAAAAVYGGWLDVSANRDSSPVARRLAATLIHRSVERAARGIEPPSLADPPMVEEGARRYATACAACHGAPGAEPQPFAGAMQPQPLELARGGGQWSPAQLFWIIRNGLRQSGMPAWQPTYVDGEIWTLVAFVVQMPQMEAARYQAIVAPPPPPAESAAPPAPEPDVIPPSEGDEGTPPALSPPPPAVNPPPAEEQPAPRP